jgi:succinate dehydrogenase / fumarate reductase cytochrome b subunit
MNGYATDYDLVVALFKNPLYSALYVFSFILLGIHLNHGFQSAFQSIGANHSRYTPILKKAGSIFSIIVSVGFSAIAIYFSFN